jgi:hypothetical protein
LFNSNSYSQKQKYGQKTRFYYNIKLKEDYLIPHSYRY